jgi:hypothetical protein
MAIQIVPDVFQNFMSNLTHDMKYAKTYLDDLLILAKVFCAIECICKLLNHPSSKHPDADGVLYNQDSNNQK